MTARLWSNREMWAGCFGLLGWVVTATAIAVACLPSESPRENLLALGLGTAAGVGLAFLQPIPRRRLGLVPFAALGLLVPLAWQWWYPGGVGPCLLVGLFGGLGLTPLATYPLSDAPAGVATIALTAAVFGAFVVGRLAVPLGVVVGLVAVAAAVAWRVFLREALEQLTEILLVPVYRVRGAGPGLERVPPHGPVVVVANHAAYLDPVWLGKVLPRQVTPMLTSIFYDRPQLRWLMKHVVKAIRVQWSRFRREVPELGEAAAALDRGACLLIFPEGWLRRHETPPLRQFGRGVWEILRQRPETPVVVCWIEGGWGSYFSYRGGPPGKNKRPDFWRPIGVAVGPPEVLPAELLADQRATRNYLMQTCLNRRKELGLEPLPLGAADKEAPEKDEEE